MGSEAQPQTELSRRGAAYTMPESGAGGSDFRLLADALPPPVSICRPDGTLDYLKRRGIEYFGSSLNPPPGPFLCGSSTHPEDDARALSAWGHAMHSGDPLNLETRLRRFDGAFRWHLSRAQPVRDRNGSITKW